MDLEKAYNFAIQSLKDNNLNDWKVEYYNRTVVLGSCHYNEKMIRLSRKLTAEQDEEIVRDTILHEIAHALTPGDGHGFAWSDKCKELGCKPFALYHESDYNRKKEIEVEEEIEEDKYFCIKCKKERGIVALLNEKLARLNCKHLVVYDKDKIIHPVLQVKTPVCDTNLSESNLISPIKEEETFDFSNSKTGHKPYHFQWTGINFIQESGFKCLIADEMGLGKTIQALGGLKKFQDELFPCLIMVKASLKMQWMVQLLDWCGVDFIPQIIEDGKNPPVELFNVHIVSYDILRRFTVKKVIKKISDYGTEMEIEEETNPFYDFPYKSVIMDEVQAIKGDSKRTNEVKKICQGKKAIIALSGTPIKNSAAEYFTILNLLRPELFPSKKHYLNYWVESEFRGGFTKYKGIRYPEEFKKFTSSFVIRRTREEAMPDLPKVNRIFYHVDFESEKLKKQYERAENDFLKEMESKANKSPLEIIARIAVMRHLIGINKIIPTVEKAQEYLEDNDRKFVIFVHHEDVQKTIYNLIQKFCLENKLASPLLFHAGLNSHERYAIIEQLKNTSSRVMIASTLAAGEGLNMQFCHDCIIAERQWNPANEEQAEGRFIRIGQESDHVDAIYMVASGTIDEYFTEIVESKRRYMEQTLEGKDSGWSEASLLTQLYEIVASKNRKALVRGF